MNMLFNKFLPQTNFNAREIPEEAKNFIRLWEALSLVAYLCPANKLTIGYGHTKGVFRGQVITKQLAEALLEADLQEVATIIHKYVKVPLNDYQFSALLSFVFNLGESNFRGSTLLILVNQNRLELASWQFPRWNKITAQEKLPNGTIIKKKVVSKGLKRRRAAELALWSKPIDIYTVNNLQGDHNG